MPTGIWLYSYCALWLMLALVSLLLVALMRQVTQLHTFHIKSDPYAGLRQGEPAPSFTAIQLFYDIDDSNATIDWTFDPSTLSEISVLVFGSPGCTACKTMARTLKELLREKGQNDHDYPIVNFIIRGSNALAREFAISEGLNLLSRDCIRIIVDPSDKAASRYHISLIPYTVLIDSNGLISTHGGGFTSSEFYSLILQAKEIDNRRHSNQVERHDFTNVA